MKTTKSLLAFIPALALAGAMLHGAGVAGAAPGPTPSYLTGAANMTINGATLIQKDAGMFHAMSVNVNGNGDNGMWCAVYITNGLDTSGCPGH